MPSGMITVDQRNTFSVALLLGVTQKMKFGKDEPDMADTGERKWSAEVAVTYLAEGSYRPVSEVISVSLVSGTDPGASVAPGSPVEFDRLRCACSAPERRQNERGDRIVGGKLDWVAASMRASAGQNGRRPAMAEVKGEQAS